MPKTGFRSITVKDEIYTHWENFWNENKPGLSMLGITTFTGFITAILFAVKNNDQSYLNKIFNTKGVK